MSDYWRQQQLDQQFAENQRRQMESARMAQERIRQAQEATNNVLWWQRFYQFFDQQRDELQRQQREWVRESLRQMLDERHQMRRMAGHRGGPGHGPRAAEAQTSAVHSKAGENIGADQRLAEYVRAFHATFAETPAIRELWKECTEDARSFADARRKFWKEVNEGDSKEADYIREMLRQAGYRLQDGSGAPMLDMPGYLVGPDGAGVRAADLRLSIDHVDPQSKAKEKALDPANLRFMSQRDNSTRRHNTLYDLDYIGVHHIQDIAQAVNNRLERAREQGEIRQWWQRFYQFFDQQRDEMQRNRVKWLEDSFRPTQGVVSPDDAYSQRRIQEIAEMIKEQLLQAHEQGQLQQWWHNFYRTFDQERN